MVELIKIQNELKVPKGNLNKFGNYKYRSAEDILEAVKPILFKHGALLTLTDSIEAIGNKLFLKATARLIIGTTSGELVTGYAELAEHKGMSAEQATGTASSYARKYALNGLFLIDETEQDADNDKVSKPIPPLSVTAIQAETLTNEKYEAMLTAIANGKKADVKKAMAKYFLSPEQEENLIKLTN